MSMSNGKEIVWGAGYGGYTAALHKLGSLKFEHSGNNRIQDEQIVISHVQAQKAIDALVADTLDEAARRLKQAGYYNPAQIVNRLKEEYLAKAEASTVWPEGLPKEGVTFTENAGPFPAREDDEIRVTID